jgi:hypothetical protein
VTDAEFEAAVARIGRIRERWQEPLGLDDWRVTWKFEREHSEELKDVVANCNVSWEYEMATVTWFIPQVLNCEFDDDDLEQIVVHEIMHILLNEMREDTKKRINHEERVATRLAKAFIRTREAATEEGNSGGG